MEGIGRPPPRLPADNIFAINHLDYVMSSPETLQSYLSEAIGIDTSFLLRFQPFQWASALEQTLYARPENVPTERFLQAQRLWIIHKLLVHIPGFKDRISGLLQALQQYDPSEKETRDMRLQLSAAFKDLSQKLSQSHIPILVVVDDMDMFMRRFVQDHKMTLQREQHIYMERRCQIIRWFAWTYTEQGPGLLQNASIDQLLHLFLQWSLTQPSPSPAVFNNTPSHETPSNEQEFVTVTPPMETFGVQQSKRSPLRVDAPTFVPKK
jgi:hypothetical protein